MRILITSGGTEEPIDGVRYITNFSTGRTGAVIADYLAVCGVESVLVHGRHAVLPETDMERYSFTTFIDLDRILQELLGTDRTFDAVIHCAAVSDFSLDYIQTETGEIFRPEEKGKISSSGSLTIHMKPNYKILDRIKSYNGNRGITVIGYKLTNTDSEDEIQSAVKKVLSGGRTDFIVHNNLPEITQKVHPATIYSSEGEIVVKTATKAEMAKALLNLIKQGDLNDTLH